jgi:hypothetical protein
LAFIVWLTAQGKWNMRTQCFFVVAALSLCPLAPASTQPVGWQKYVVPETGANIDFPNEIFSQDAGRPDQGYGRRFQTSDSRANLTVNSISNDEHDTPASFLRKHFKLPPSAAVYRRVTRNFFVVSGFHNKNIWYDRCNFAGAFIHCVALNYPAHEKRQWDYVVTQISHTLASR